MTGMRLAGVELYSCELRRSRVFYEQVVGLKLSEEEAGHHVMFDSGETFLCVEVLGAENYLSQDKAVIFLEVDDLAGAVARIGQDRFVKYERKPDGGWAGCTILTGITFYSFRNRRSDAPCWVQFGRATSGLTHGWAGGRLSQRALRRQAVDSRDCFEIGTRRHFRGGRRAGVSESLLALRASVCIVPAWWSPDLLLPCSHKFIQSRSRWKRDTYRGQ
jgi:hypothetical protein